MKVYVVFNPIEEMTEICKDIPAALALVDSLVYGSYRVSREEHNTYIHTNEGTYTIMEWNVLE